MRKALNENPIVQLSLLGVLLLIAGIFLLPRLTGGDEQAAEPTAGVDGSLSVDGEEVASGTATIPGSAPQPATSASPAAGSVSPEALIPGPGLPADVARAWKGGDAIVLLIVRPKGTDDKLVRASLSAVDRPGVSVFVAEAKDVARYSRITQGVGVSQVPALVVVRPRKVSGEVPDAQVSYGFRNAQSVVQAIDDALYEGSDDLPYHPR